MAENERIIRLSEVLERIPYSRSHLYRLEKAGTFPRRLKLGARRVGWRSSDIADWIIQRAAGDRHE